MSTVDESSSSEPSAASQQPAGAEKVFLDAQDLLEDSFRLAAQIFDSGFRPTFIIAVWRGGAPIGIAVQEFLAYRGVRANHIAIRTAAYSGIDERSREVAVFGLSYLVKNVEYSDRLLIVDDVFDTGRTIEAIIDALRHKARLNTPHDIRVAVPYFKPSRNLTAMTPDYYLHETERWLKYPHSLEGLTTAEIREHRPAIYEILRNYLPE